MKRLSIALAALGLSAGALAALPAATDPTIVSVPQLPGGFVIGGSGFYLQPSDTNGDLDYASINSGTNTTFSSSLQNVQPGYDWGWGVNVGYIFPNTGNDVNLSYFELDTSDTSTSGIGGASFIGVNPTVTPVNFDPNGNLFTDITTVRSKAQYDINQVDLTAGQFIDVGCRLILHPNIGLRWADLERKLTTAYFAPGVPGVASGGISLFGRGNGGVGTFEKSDFSGIGPLAGLDASYYIGMGFGAVAHADSAILVGNINSHTNSTIVNNAEFPPGNFNVFNSFSASNQQRIVPVVDMKLGADYTYVFNNAANSDLTLEAGWMFSNYFNAVDRLTVSAADAATGTGNTIFARTTSDIGIQGPYVSLVFHA